MTNKYSMQDAHRIVETLCHMAQGGMDANAIAAMRRVLIAEIAAVRAGVSEE